MISPSYSLIRPIPTSYGFSLLRDFFLLHASLPIVFRLNAYNFELLANFLITNFLGFTVVLRDTWHLGTKPDPRIRVLTNGSGSCYFFHWPSRHQKNTIFSAYYFLNVHLHSRNQDFSHYFCLMIEGSGYVPPNKGSGSKRPKNKRIRIRNTTLQCLLCSHIFSLYAACSCRWGSGPSACGPRAK